MFSWCASQFQAKEAVVLRRRIRGGVGNAGSEPSGSLLQECQKHTLRNLVSPQSTLAPESSAELQLPGNTFAVVLKTTTMSYCRAQGTIFNIL